MQDDIALSSVLAGRISTTINPDNSRTVAASWYHLDHLNSTKAVSDASGSLEVFYEYRAFGEQLKKLDAAGAEVADKAKYSYGGKELDEDTELYYFNARYYDSSIGRFINVDPIQDGWNWYVYCENNPMSFTDPSGLVELGVGDDEAEDAEMQEIARDYEREKKAFEKLDLAYKAFSTGNIELANQILTSMGPQRPPMFVQPTLTPEQEKNAKNTLIVFGEITIGVAVAVSTIASLPVSGPISLAAGLSAFGNFTLGAALTADGIQQGCNMLAGNEPKSVLSPIANAIIVSSWLDVGNAFSKNKGSVAK